jgi:hypothetical protein
MRREVGSPRPSIDLDVREEALDIAELLRWQADACARLGSPLYGLLLERAADDFTAGGPVADVLRGHEDDPRWSMLALRLMGAVHRLVLAGDAPELAPYYPSAGGAASGESVWPAFRSVVGERREELRRLVDRPVQTNEVGRSAALLGGFLVVARETGLPLRLLEIGASAGLNLRWDRYRYESAAGVWGDAGSRVRFTDVFTGKAPPLDVDARVVERAGCDRNPLDPTTEEGRLTVLAYVWADQLDRIRLLEAALAIAAAVPVRLERADAADWLDQRLTVDEGAATVLFHSIVVQYLERERRVHMRKRIEAVGAEATDAAPLAWVRMEPAGERADVRVTTWPGGEERLLATAGYHGRDVEWLL